MSVSIKTDYLKGYVSESQILSLQDRISEAHRSLYNHTGKGNEFTGWLNLPECYDKAEFSRIKEAAKRICENTDVFICIGIGGSYLGAKAVIDFIKTSNYNSLKKNTPDIYFIGNSISPDELNSVFEICKDRDVSINVISKSGTTTEPAIAFRFFKSYLEEKYGKEEAAKRIYITTDKSKGTLKYLSDREGYDTFVVPDDIGGRYSVLTAVGLLPIAVCGIDIDGLIRGARAAMTELDEPDVSKNACYKYAAARNLLYKENNKKVELLVSYEPSFSMMGEWFKQLFGESEGKENLGIFPASAAFSTDLHSLGQYIQQGERQLFETVVYFKYTNYDFVIKKDDENLDGLNFLTGMKMSQINETAFKATLIAHFDGGVPNIVLEVKDKSEYELGYLIYFFEKACAVSGYLLGVNPFDQPGVESYKKNMFALLGKSGYEEERKILEKRLNS